MKVAAALEAKKQADETMKKAMELSEKEAEHLEFEQKKDEETAKVKVIIAKHDAAE